VIQTKNTPSTCVILKPKEDRLAKGQQKIKVIAAAPSQKSAGVVMSDKLPPAAV
jgi:hypothetical protein